MLKIYFRLDLNKNYIALMTPLFAIRLAWSMKVWDKMVIEDGWTLYLLPAHWNLFRLKEGESMYRYVFKDVIRTFAEYKVISNAI